MPGPSSGEALTVDGLLTIKDAKPFNLFNIASLRNKGGSGKTPELRDSVRCALEPFAKMIRKNGGKPLLCELAVISDKNQWQHVVVPDDSREFVSIIDTYEDELDPELRHEFIDRWKNAIRSLGISQRGRKQANYIVLNPRVYDAVAYYEKFFSQDDSPNGSGQRETCCNNTSNSPEAQIEHFSIDGKEKASLENAIPQKSINLLIKETLVRASGTLKDDLQGATLAILPFSRPYVDPAKIDQIRKENDTSLSILLDQDVEKDLGGCLFAIYKNPLEESNNPDSNLVQDYNLNLNFFLSAQYLLTLSVLAEARRNLVLYYEEQRRRNWGYLVHQFKNDITQLLTNIKQVYKVVQEKGALNSDLKERFELARDQMQSMLEIADLIVNASSAKKNKLSISSIDNLLHYFENDMEELANLESRDLKLESGEKISIKFGELDSNDAAIKGMSALKYESNDKRLVNHIGKARKIICHEVIKNVRRYAGGDTDTDTDTEKTKSVKCGLFSDKEWVYFICQNYICDGENKHESPVLEGAKNLQQTNGEEFKSANCIAQFRVGMSVLHDPPGIKVKVSESNHPPVFTIAIPVGKFKSENGRHGNS